MIRSTCLLPSADSSPLISLLRHRPQFTSAIAFSRLSRYSPTSIRSVLFRSHRRQVHLRFSPLLPAMEPAICASGSQTHDGSAPDPNSNPRVLPPELSKNVVHLECQSSAEGGNCDVYLLGTAHVSTDSCREVQAVISYLKPQVVFLELCPSRVTMLTPQTLKVPTVNEMIDTWKKKKMNAFGILYSWFLAKVAEKLDVMPGAEFRVAFEEARSYGAKVILGDRPLQITLRRTWGKMSPWYRAKFIYYTLFQAVFLPSAEDLNLMLRELDDVDMLTLMVQELSKAFPTIMETLIHERDLYMSASLLKVAKEHSSVVAVMGKGHLGGVKKHWQQPIEGRHLMEIPTKGAGTSGMKILIPLSVAGFAIATCIYLMGKR